MKPRILRFAQPQTTLLPCASEEVWEPVWLGHRLLTRLALLLEVLPGVELTPIRCLVLAHIGRESGLGVHASRLARELCVPRATLRYHLDYLSGVQLIRSKGPGPHDRRRQRLVLTPAGASALDEAAALLVDLTAGGDWPADAPRRSHWSLRRVPADASADGHVRGDPYPGVSTRRHPGVSTRRHPGISSRRQPPDRRGDRGAPPR